MFIFSPTLAPPPPFPAIIAEHRRYEEVAPGVERAEYDVRTRAGPLVIQIVAANLSNPTVHVRATLADDRIISQAEPLTSMARRSDAVAGINGDFFDIEQSNAPLNVLVRDGVVLRSPGFGRPALGVLADGSVVFGTPVLEGTVRTGNGQAPLAAVDVWPARGYALLRPLYGAPPPQDAVQLPDGSSLAFPNDMPAPVPPISVSASITIDGEPVQESIGGGPLLLRDGQPYDDPNAPEKIAETSRFPVSGAGIAARSTLLLVEVDGRQPGYSIGLTRPQFTALFQALGASDALEFDSGGSATIVARPLGEEHAELLNRPSDRRERPIADALTIWSSAPTGHATRLVVRPHALRIVPGATLTLRIAAIDAGDHPADLPEPARLTLVPPSLGGVAGDAFSAAPSAMGNGTLAIGAGALHSEVPITIVRHLARLELQAPTTNPDLGTALHVRAVGYDEQGNAVAVDGAVSWRLDGAGAIDRDGGYTAPMQNADAVVTATAGGASGTLALGIGRHTVALPWQTAWFRFASYPSGEGHVATDEQCGCLRLGYDFTQQERAAYARTSIELNGAPLAFSVEAFGDGGGEWLRLRLSGADGRLYLLTLAHSVDWNGWRRVETLLPADAVFPLTLQDLYVVRRKSATVGALRFRDPVLSYPGVTTPTPVAVPYALRFDSIPDSEG